MEEVNMKQDDRYRIFFGPSNSIWQCIFYDVKQSSEYEYCDFGDKCNTRIKEILMSVKLHKYMPHFIKRILYRKVLRYSFLKLPRNSDIFFAFTNGFELCSDNDRFLFFLDFLRKEFKKSKFGIHYAESLCNWSIKKISEIKRRFDVVLTFNRYDAECFDIEYYGMVNEKGMFKISDAGGQSDVFYSGGFSSHDGSRFRLVLKIFRHLTDKGKKCEFFMCGLSEEYIKELLCELNSKQEVLKKDVVKYGDSNFHYNVYLPYASNLSWIKKTKVMLEVIMPEVRATCTNRPALAMCYECKLLTNSSRIAEESWYLPENISIFDDVEDIDLSFFDTPFCPTDYDFSGIRMLKHMEEKAYR
jgi:hypothetical protein